MVTQICQNFNRNRKLPFAAYVRIDPESSDKMLGLRFVSPSVNQWHCSPGPCQCGGRAVARGNVITAGCHTSRNLE